MNDLVAFLLARIAEDEAANATGPEPESWCDRADGLHLDHQRALAECGAKRRIVEACTHEVIEWVKVRPGVSEKRAVRKVWIEDDTAENVLRALSLVYWDHMNYDEGWKPLLSHVGR
jgi:hypothetical protein